MKLLGFIPARSGQKWEANKDIKYLVGKELMGWAIEAAINANFGEVMLDSSNKRN